MTLTSTWSIHLKITGSLQTDHVGFKILLVCFLVIFFSVIFIFRCVWHLNLLTLVFLLSMHLIMYLSHSLELLVVKAPCLAGCQLPNSGTNLIGPNNKTQLNYPIGPWFFVHLCFVVCTVYIFTNYVSRISCIPAHSYNYADTKAAMAWIKITKFFWYRLRSWGNVHNLIFSRIAKNCVSDFDNDMVPDGLNISAY